jgi:glycosyltransferase involved in cell wall biosynthesis
MTKIASLDVAYFPLGAAAFGGAERSILELATAQQAAGRRVAVFHESALAGTDFVTQAQAADVPLVRVGWAPEQPLSTVAREAWRLFGGLDARLVHFNISWRSHMWLVPVIARWRCRARLVGSMRAMPDRYDLIPRRRYFGVIPGLQLWKLPDLVVGRVWARALHATVSVNRDDYPPRLVSEFGFPSRRLSVIYNGVRLPEALPSDSGRAQARAALGLPADAFVAVYVGRVSQEKGVRYAIEALPAAGAGAHLVIAGDGNDLEAARARALELGVGDRVHFLGYVADPSSLYAAAHVALVPSLWNEAFGRVVVEAMGQGVPVIATAVGGMQELFDHGVQGLFVPKADAAAIGAAMARLRADGALRGRMATAARVLAVERYSTQRVAAEYGSLYEALSDA